MPEVKLQMNKAYSFLKEYPARWEVIMGGAGAGKSYAVFQDVVVKPLEEPKRKFVCIRKVAKSLRWSVYAQIKDILAESNLSNYYKENKSEMSFSIDGKPRIILLGLDDVEKMKSIVGVTDIILEEATEFTPADLTQLNLRLRVEGVKNRIVLLFNPIINTHHLKRKFFDKPGDNVRTHVMTYKDNAFLDEEYVKELMALEQTDPNSYKIYTLGQWGELSEGVFTNFIVHDFDYDWNILDRVGSGLDFGFNHASALIVKGWRDGELYAFDELWMKGRTNSELIVAARDFFVSSRVDWTSTRIRGDSAEPDRIMEFYNEGFYGLEAAKKGKGSLLSGIDFLKSVRVHIHKTRCPHLAEEFGAFQWRLDRDGTKLDEPVCMNDDAIAALRYATEDDRAGFVGVDEKLRRQMRERRMMRER